LAVKPFLPQLQRTFVKALGDEESPSIRDIGANNVVILVNYLPRLDPIVSELLSILKSNSSDNVQEATWNALGGVLSCVNDSKPIIIPNLKAIEDQIFKDIFKTESKEKSTLSTSS